MVSAALQSVPLQTHGTLTSVLRHGELDARIAASGMPQTIGSAIAVAGIVRSIPQAGPISGMTAIDIIAAEIFEEKRPRRPGPLQEGNV